MATRSIAERRRAITTPLRFRLPAPQFERQQALRAALGLVLARLYQAQLTLERWGAKMHAAARDAHVAERALRLRVAGSRWLALVSERGRRAWRARQAMQAARRQIVVTGRTEPLTAGDADWTASIAATRVEFHDAPAPVAVGAMPSTPLPETLWRQWHEPAADRVPHAPPLRLAAVVALVAAAAVLALSVVTFAAVTHGWRGLPAFGQSNTPLHPIVVIHSGQTPTPSVDQPPYYVGAWVSDSAPQPTSVVTVYVRVTNSSTQAPVPGVAVSVLARFTCQGGSTRTFGPATTGADGVAAVQVSFSGLPVGQPVCLTANAAVGGQTFSADTTFTAAFPAAPTAAPTAVPTPPGGGDGGGGGGFPWPTPTPPGHRKP